MKISELVQLFNASQNLKGEAARVFLTWVIGLSNAELLSKVLTKDLKSIIREVK